MSDSVASLRHKISSAEELESVVRTMKAMAASSIGQYENAVRSLDDYYRTVQLGLSACFRQHEVAVTTGRQAYKEEGITVAVVFGSDQGLVGQFNDVMVAFALDTLAKLPGNKSVWAVGERIETRLTESELPASQVFMLPNSISAITPLVGQILIEMETQRELGVIDQVYLFHNSPQSGAIYKPGSQQLLPLDAAWSREQAVTEWPTKYLPEVMNSRERTLRALIREYLFVSLFRTCAESLASENASRLAAMQRAEKNIGELQEELRHQFHRMRQSSIDEELFDVIAGFEALR